MITFTTINFILLILWIFIISYKLEKITKKFEGRTDDLKKAQNDFSKKGNEHLKVLMQFAKAEGYEIKEDVVIKNKEEILHFKSEPLVLKVLTFKESEEKSRERHFMEEHLLPSIENMIEKMSPVERADKPRKKI